MKNKRKTEKKKSGIDWRVHCVLVSTGLVVCFDLRAVFFNRIEK